MARRLIERGFRKVRPLAGGLEAWIAAGYAVEIENRADGEPYEEKERS